MVLRTSKKLTVATIVFAMVFGAFAPVGAASDAGEETRFFVQTKSDFWRKALGVRHEFPDGFTTEATGLQLGLARIMVDVYPVQRLNILPAEESVEPSSRGASPEKKPDFPPGKPSPTPDPEPTPEPSPEPSPEPRPAPTLPLPWGVDMLTGGTGDGSGVTVAVLDTGVYTQHPDLVRRVLQCKDFSHRKNPIIDEQCDDGHGHGTHVAGTIVADGGEDGLGIFGVAPNANLYAYKVCGKNGSCWSDDISVAIRHAVDEGAQIINLSLGSDNVSSLIADAVDYAVEQGVLVVAAAGNDGPYQGSIDYPGAFVSVIAVGALDVDSAIADWSSRGGNSTTEPFVTEEGDIEFAAPGVNVESTSNDGSYTFMSGTSMASPHVAGLAASLWDSEAENAADAVRDLLHALSGDLEPAGDDDDSGWGLPTQ